MFKLFLILSAYALLAKCDDQSDQSVYINVLIQKYLKLEKETWDMLSNANSENENLIRIRSLYGPFVEDPFLRVKDSLHEHIIPQTVVYEGSDQWNITMDYFFGHNSNRVTRTDAKSHINKLLDKDYTKYWSLTEIDYFKIVKEKSDEQSCSSEFDDFVQPTSQILFSYYNDISKSLFKTYSMLQLSYMLLKSYNFKDHSNDVVQLRNMYKARISQIQRNAKETMEASKSDTWKCIHQLKYTPDIQITNFLQGFIDNEVNLSSDQSCQSACADYSITRSYACNEGTYCDKIDSKSTNRAVAQCKGTVRDCKFIEGNMDVCAASGNLTETMRYTSIIFDSGKRIGSESCTQPTKVESWIRWFVRCSTCFCLCDEISNSDRYFSLRPVLSDTKNNEVITGVALQKINGIFQWSVTENRLQSKGQLNVKKPIVWKKSRPFRVSDSKVEDGIDFHTLTYDHRGINLDTLEVPVGSTVTGLRFQIHNGNLILEIRATEFDFNTGLLSTSHEWISNTHRSDRFEINLNKPGIPTKYAGYNFPNSKPINIASFITFQPTDIDKDIAQHTVPFISNDLLRNENQAFLLSGIGVSWMNVETSGGVIVPKMVAYNFAQHISVVTD